MDARFRRFLRGVGFDLTPPPKERDTDCCDSAHATTLRLGPCRHLRAGEPADIPQFTCAVYSDPQRPQLCADFNCVSWAKASNTYTAENELVVRAQQAWDALRARHAMAGGV